MISKEQLEEFKGIYRKEFGKDISDQEALEWATKLIDLIRAVYKPMAKTDFEKLKKRQHETSE